MTSATLPAPQPGTADLHTVLVSMPFQSARRPSIQIGLLAAIANRAGFHTRTLHAGVDFAALIGPELYELLCEHRGRLVGEWLFSAAAFGVDDPDPQESFLDDFRADLEYFGERDRLREIRRYAVPAYLDTLIAAHSWDGVDVVGFSSTFQQNAASIALARRLKRHRPELLTVFGGANVDGTMGLALLEAVPGVDLVVVGEGDAAFPALLETLAAGGDPLAVPGVAARRDGDVCATPPGPPFTAMDSLPAPDYDEFFAARNRTGLDTRDDHGVVLPFESARGCWWGAKHHCTFCGLNGISMQFRAKSVDRVLAELAGQAARYRTFCFEAVDNIIDPGYLRTLLPGLVEADVDYELFYEIKANVTRAELRLLAAGGVRHIQPGIESLSTDVLRLMRKGVRSGQNVNLLRWARYYGIDTSWNLIWGFPGETAAQYAAQAAVIPHLVHLQPPSGANRVWMERFSPMFEDRTGFPTRYRRPEASYRYVYPAAVDLERLAYFFDYEFEQSLPEAVYEPVRAAVRAWADAWAREDRPELVYRRAPGVLRIDDTRWPGTAGAYRYTGVLADLYRACSDRPISVAALADRLAGAISAAAIDEVVEEWRRSGLVFVDDGTVLALALPATPLR